MKNEYTITKRLMKSWEKGWWFNSATNTTFLIFSCFFGALFFVLPQMFIHYLGYYASLKSLYTALWVICHVGTLFLILYIPYVPRINYANPSSSNHQHNHYKTCSINYCTKRWKRSIELTENEITVYDHNSVLKFEYSAIKRIKERRRLAIIFLKSGFEIRLYKKAFVEGSWGECKSLISRKTSVKVK